MANERRNIEEMKRYLKELVDLKYELLISNLKMEDIEKLNEEIETLRTELSKYNDPSTDTRP